jgi:hypothetical protein
MKTQGTSGGSGAGERTRVHQVLARIEEGVLARRTMGESADLDWGDLESEVRDLVVVVRRKKIQEVLEAVDRINDMILKHVEL